MDDEQAHRFAQRMIETWPNGPRRNVWYDIALKLHDPAAARTAYADLERTATHISTAQFHTTYQAAKRRTQQHQPREYCDLCDDTGWVDTDIYQLTIDDDTPPTTKVKPCRCTRGQQMIETQRRILEANRR